MRLLCLLVLSACAVDELDLDAETQEVDTSNGTSLNGTSLNGTSLNGTSLNGTSLNGTSISGISATGRKVTASNTSGPPLSGTGHVGSKWTGTSDTGAAITLLIDSAQQGTAPNSDLWFYGVSYQTSTGWSPLCGLDATGAPIKAVTVAGVWSTTTATYASSTTQFTFACRTKTIAKCVELGYKTYRSATTQLASCVRLLRGDYCGNGKPFTLDGQLLNLYDNIGIQLDTQSWAPEAEWTPAGARCLNDDGRARLDLRQNTPVCIDSIPTSATCGKQFASTTILIDELPPVQ
jgi:hypothetical protein